MTVRRVLPEPAAPVQWADAYRWPAPARGRGTSFVRANFVVSIDGAAAVTGRVGALSRPLDQQLFGWLRSTADAVLVGASTVRAERYGPVRISEEQQDEREADGRPRLPPIVTVTRSCSLDWTAPVFAADDGARPIVVTTELATAEALDQARAVADVLVVGRADVDLDRLLVELQARGMTRVLTEGGPTLLAELWRQHLVDELCMTIAPLMVGGSEPRLLGPGFAGLDELTLLHVLDGDGDLFLRYGRQEG